MLQAGDIIEFDRKKQFKYIKPLGAGGTGDTHLFEDETTNMFFAFKKYAPKDTRYVDDHYRRFVDEIKILLKLSHQNIVRVYNYYLYPDLKIGYIQMEYIDAMPIDNFETNGWGRDWNDIFTDVILAFEYLETNKVLHRDIRPANILIDKEEKVKIIDFGFGKQLDNTCQAGRSVLLNWPVTELPEEIQQNLEYNLKTEIYFVGKLFQRLIKSDMDFRFSHIIENMVKISPKHRYDSFSEVSKSISEGLLGEISFTEIDKEIYRNFANKLCKHINWHIDRYTPVKEINETIISLANLIRDSALEEFIQDNTRLIHCFIKNGFNYAAKTDIPVKCIIDFHQFLKQLNSKKQKIVLDNIYTRLSKINIKSEEELPF